MSPITKTRPRTPVVLLLLGLSLAVCAGFATAETKTFTGAVSSDWVEPNNWDPPGVPGVDDQAYIGQSAPPCQMPDGTTSVGEIFNNGQLQLGDVEIHTTQFHNSETGNVSITTSVNIQSLGAADCAFDNLGEFRGDQANCVIGGASDGSVSVNNEGCIQVDNFYTHCAHFDTSVRSTLYANNIAISCTGQATNMGRICGLHSDDGPGGSVFIVAGSLHDYGLITGGTSTNSTGGSVYIHVHGECRVIADYTTAGIINGGQGARGGSVRIQAGSLTTMAGTRVSGGASTADRGSDVTVIVSGAVDNAGKIVQGSGTQVGQLIVSSGTGINSTGMLGPESCPLLDDYAGNITLAAPTVTIATADTNNVTADSTTIVGNEITISTVPPAMGIFSVGDLRLFCAVTGTQIDVSAVDTVGVLTVGGNYIFADNVIDPLIGYQNAFIPEPVVSGTDPSYLDAAIGPLSVVECVGGGGSLETYLRNESTAAQVIEYSVTSALGWVSPMAGSTTSLEPFADFDLSLSYAVPEGVEVGTIDVITAELTIGRSFSHIAEGCVLCAGDLGMSSDVPCDPTLSRVVLSVSPSVFMDRCRIEIAGDVGTHSSAVVSIFDLGGRRITQLHPDETGRLTWRPPSRLAGGVYLLSVRRGGRHFSGRVILLR